MRVPLCLSWTSSGLFVIIITGTIGGKGPTKMKVGVHVTKMLTTAEDLSLGRASDRIGTDSVDQGYGSLADREQL